MKIVSLLLFTTLFPLSYSLGQSEEQFYCMLLDSTQKTEFACFDSVNETLRTGEISLEQRSDFIKVAVEHGGEIIDPVLFASRIVESGLSLESLSVKSPEERSCYIKVAKKKISSTKSSGQKSNIDENTCQSLADEIQQAIGAPIKSARNKCYQKLFWHETRCKPSEKQKKGQAGNPYAAIGICSIEKPLSVRKANNRGPNCLAVTGKGDKADIIKQIKCCHDMMVDRNGRYFGPVLRGLVKRCHKL